MKPIDIQEIRSLALFSKMADINFETLIRGAYIQNFPPQIELITEDEPCDFLHIVVEGSVELFSRWNGRETAMATVRPISTFILAAAIKDSPYLMSARTNEKSRIILLPSKDVRAVFDIDNTFARSVVNELAQCYRSVVKTTKNLKLRTSIERLANYFLRQYTFAGNAVEFELKMEKRLLASYLGMTPENLSRAIKALQPYGVHVNGSRVTISNLADLIAFAKPTASIDDPSY